LNARHTPGRSEFAAELHAEHAGYGHFLSILESERDCLLKGDAEALLTVSRAKSDKVLDLVRLGESRTAFLRRNKCSADRSGMSAYFKADSGADHDDLVTLWNELIVLADQARLLNESNGALITTRLAHNQKALDVLSGMLSQNRTYGPDGHTESTSLGSHLGTA
jgi:flagella synthesis protein FlgN